jgi:hypothetical protein
MSGNLDKSQVSPTSESTTTMVVGINNNLTLWIEEELTVVVSLH